jgi:hypothetical protein
MSLSAMREIVLDLWTYQNRWTETLQVSLNFRSSWLLSPFVPSLSHHSHSLLY